MLKIAGSALILCACMGYAGGLLGQIGRRRDILKACLELTELLSGEIRYERIPMAEALYKIRDKLDGELSNVLTAIADGLETGDYTTMEELWGQSFDAAQGKLFLTGEELKEVKDIGKNLGFLDLDVQIGHLSGCRERLLRRFNQVQKELEEKRKLYRSLGLAAGIFAILILL